MAFEYLLFDLLVLAGPLVLGFFGPTYFRGRSLRAWVAVFAAAIPFLIWDALVADRHWFFSSEYTLGPELFGLPIEEWLFFAAVPYALIFSWELLLDGGQAPKRQGAGAKLFYGIAALMVPVGIWQLVEGRGYTGLTALALGLVGAVDWISGAKVATRRAFWPFVGIVGLTTAIFDTYLTMRPVVTYDDAYNLGVRLGTIPVEDFGYGLASGLLALSIYTWMGQRNFVDGAIEGVFEGYRHHVVVPDPAAPLCLREGPAPTVAVIGTGLAGMRAASVLAQRGFAVQMFEKNHYLGGKIGAWTERVDGVDLPVEHGFHAFFRQYYNLDAFLSEVGIRRDFQEIEDYKILGNDGRRHGFAGVRNTPLLNLISLLSTGMFTLGDVVFNPKTHKMQAFMEYERESTYAKFDDTSFAEFAEQAALPPNLMLVFNSFSRAFFAPAEDMSMAELIKSFHFYFLGHDHGLAYDYPTEHYEHSMLAPLRSHLEGHGVDIHLERPVGELVPEGEAMRVDGERFDHVVLATDVVGATHIVGASPQLRAAAPRLASQCAKLKSSSRYAVLRVWAKRRGGDDLPVFCITEGHEILDSISFYHRIDTALGQWAAEHDGGVYELHAYSIPDSFSSDEAAIEAQLIEELFAYLPELRGMKIEHRVLQVHRNFTALHVGQHATRPATGTEHPALVLAGDWVDLPVPAMLMEGACTSGLYAANEILRRYGLREAAVDSVPARGLLAPSRFGKSPGPGENDPASPGSEPKRSGGSDGAIASSSETAQRAARIPVASA